MRRAWLSAGALAIALHAGCGERAVGSRSSSGTSSTWRSSSSSTPGSMPHGASAGAGGDAVDDRAPIEVLEGRASYYADSLAGNHTANGDIYDPSALTAASRDLAFGTVVRVVRVDTGASVVVRVNDRGPFRDHSRILDLSGAAADALDMRRAGVVAIRAEILERP